PDPARHASVTARPYNPLMNSFRLASLLFAGLGVVAATVLVRGADSAKVLIAHRGASGYAPEHTFAAYDLAITQKSDFVEPDLAVSKDGVLVCLHDDTLERTTNVADVYAARFSPIVKGRNGEKRWVANDFTVSELKRLDAGIWFDAKFAGAQVPTWDEMLARVKQHPGVGVYPELKSPPLYTGRGIDMAKLFVDSVKKHGLDTADSLKRTPVIIQSFDRPTIKRMSVELPTVPRVFLTSDDKDITDAQLKDLATFAHGIAPEKRLVARHPDLVQRAHALGLSVTVWTFRTDEKTSYPSVKDEMTQFLYTFGVDAVFTNNPDQFPRR
ncbi:MAG: glycerophosphodiester phosphodiesterase family protein, partial [Vicinamibacterales bacterium]